MTPTLIRNALIVTGDGQIEPFAGDALLDGGRLLHLGDVPPADAEHAARMGRVIDADGLVLAPGFLDMHNHGALGGTHLGASGLPVACENAIRAGVTKRICGCDGLSPAPISDEAWREYRQFLLPVDGQIGVGSAALLRSEPFDRAQDKLRERLEGRGGSERHGKDSAFLRSERSERLEGRGAPGANGPDWPWRRTAEFWAWWRGRSVTDMGLHLGHGAVRRTIMGNSPTRASDSELRAMEELVRAEARDTLGLSTGLIYQPALYADLRELSALIRAANSVKPAAFFPHIRNESDAMVEAVREAAQAAVEGGGGYCNEHTKIAGARNWGQIGQIEALLDDAAASVPAMANMYLYTAGSTTGEAIFPPEFRKSRDELARHLRAPASRRAIWEWLSGGTPGWENIYGYSGGLSGIQVAGVKPGPAEAFLGMRFSEVAAARGAADPQSFAALEAIMDFFVENDLAITIITFFGDDAVVRRLFERDSMAICTDGLMPGPGQRPHPRTLGTFPKALRYAREQGIPLQRIVHRMTELPARFLGLESPVLRAGTDASLVLFDAERVRERNDYDNPYIPPEGIEHVWIHGEHVLDQGELRVPKVFPGRVLRAMG